MLRIVTSYLQCSNSFAITARADHINKNYFRCCPSNYVSSPRSQTTLPATHPHAKPVYSWHPTRTLPHHPPAPRWLRQHTAAKPRTLRRPSSRRPDGQHPWPNVTSLLITRTPTNCTYHVAMVADAVDAALREAHTLLGTGHAPTPPPFHIPTTSPTSVAPWRGNASDRATATSAQLAADLQQLRSTHLSAATAIAHANAVVGGSVRLTV